MPDAPDIDATTIAPAQSPFPVAKRRMSRATLAGQHTYATATGAKVHIWRRDEQFLARGRYNGRPFGKTLGQTEAEAMPVLWRLLTMIDDGAFVRSSEAPHRRLSVVQVPRLTLRQLLDEYLAEKRKLRGRQTAETYLARLRPALDFAEQPTSRRRWPLAADVDRSFAVELRVFLHEQTTTRNGRTGSAAKPISARQIFNILECVRGALAWAAQTEVRKLPVGWISPFTPEIVGRPPAKDPLREDPLPMERRIKFVEKMDRWQLCHLALSMILPLRPEEAAGLLIHDVDWDQCRLKIGTRFGGDDFTKGGTSFRLPFPSELRPLLRACVGKRAAGPLLRDRRVFEGRRPTRNVASTSELEEIFRKNLAAARSGTAATAQDRKAIFRKLLRQLGGVSGDQLAREFKQIVATSKFGVGVSVGMLRHAVTTSMGRCGMPMLELRYLTGHATTDILNEYAALDPDGAMAVYFESARPLLAAIGDRAGVLGITT